MKHLLPIFIVLAFFASCKKETQTIEEMLSKSAWIMTEKMVKQGTQEPENVYEGWQDCAKDDEYIFRPDKNYVVSNGPATCPGEAAILMQGTWQLSDDEKNIYYTISGVTYSYDIIELTGSKMTLRASEGGNETVNKYKH